MSTQAIEQASAIIRARGTARDRELRAYLLARGRFADLVKLAMELAPIHSLTIAA
jgi:hypothetical protein